MYEKLEKYTVNIIPNTGYEVQGQWQDDVHDIRTRILFDYYTYKILAAEATGVGTPFEVCHQGLSIIGNLVGEQVRPGFNRVVKEKVMGKNGCMHIYELVMNSIKSALQAAARQVPDWVEDDDYQTRWTGWEMLYKDKCIYFSQPGVFDNTESRVEQVQQALIREK